MSGKPKPPVVVTAPADIMQAAREECAENATSPALAESYLSGGQDHGWKMRHVVDRMVREHNVAERGSK